MTGALVPFVSNAFLTASVGIWKARAIPIIQWLRPGDWYCSWFGDLQPDYEKADVRYCREA